MKKGGLRKRGIDLRDCTLALSNCIKNKPDALFFINLQLQVRKDKAVCSETREVYQIILFLPKTSTKT